ncbi:unnamed protein product, partial [Prorocentrum cordatum]
MAAEGDSKAEPKPADGATTVDSRVKSEPTDGAATVDLTKSADEAPKAEAGGAAQTEEGKAGEAAKGSGKGEAASKQILETHEGTMLGFAAVARGLRGKGKGKGKPAAGPAAPEAAKDAAKDAGVTETGQLAG